MNKTFGKSVREGWAETVRQLLDKIVSGPEIERVVELVGRWPEDGGVCPVTGTKLGAVIAHCKREVADRVERMLPYGFDESAVPPRAGCVGWWFAENVRTAAALDLAN